MATSQDWDPEDPLNFDFGDDGYSDLLILQSPEVLGTNEPDATAPPPPPSGHSTQPSEFTNTMRADLARLSVADTPGPPDATPIVKQSLPQPEVQQPQVQLTSPRPIL